MAWLSEAPGRRLKEIVLATKSPWWFTISGVLPSAKWVKAESGTIVSFAVLTAAPAEALLLPAPASEFVEALRADRWRRRCRSDARRLALHRSEGRLLCAVPLGLPPDVLT